jgi:bifunctional UDP-N-acetylglucosamine pyrophosphorylase/glucosamine-1-phosphate N-acetyltransferase
MTDIALIVLAAGKGTRMKSEQPKVMHRAAGCTLLGHVLQSASSVGANRVAVVIGPEMEQVGLEAQRLVPNATIVEQAQQLGTGDAVKSCRDSLGEFHGSIIILYGDVPLVRPDTIKRLISTLSNEVPVVVLGFTPPEPSGYGRLILDDNGFVTAVREELDATPEERQIKICNSGILAASSPLIWRLIANLKNENAKGEYYLTDVVELAVAQGLKVALVEAEETEVMGVNDRRQLAKVESELQDRYRKAAMAAGVTLVAPETVFFSSDTKLGTDVIVEPHVFFGPGVEVGNEARILAFCYMENTKIGDGARVGPFARLRPGTVIGAGAHIGNFVEIKNSVIGAGSKANHLSYLGDTDLGPRSNVGAGTITCNYDGFDKRRTEVGADVFVGANTALVAPVKVGDGVNIAAGSVITKDVPAHALAIARASQEVREGWASRYREMKRARKKAISK